LEDGDHVTELISDDQTIMVTINLLTYDKDEAYVMHVISAV